MTLISREEGLARLEALRQEAPEITRRRIEARNKILAEQKKAFMEQERDRRQQMADGSRESATVSLPTEN